MVLEQDADLVLAPPAAAIAEPTEHLGRVLMRALNHRHHSPGSVVIAGGDPVRLFAVVHDFELEPSWRELWVEQALAAVLDLAWRRRMNALALPLLGTRHGRLPLANSLHCTLAALEQTRGGHPGRIWLQVPDKELAQVQCMLAESAAH